VCLRADEILEPDEEVFNIFLMAPVYIRAVRDATAVPGCTNRKLNFGSHFSVFSWILLITHR
jgi:hypothetical protein